MSDASPLLATARLRASAFRSLKAPRADLAILLSAFFLQRFSLPFGKSQLQLVAIPLALIVLREFAGGRLEIDYDRLWWFLVLTFALTSSLAMNFQATMLPAYGLLVVLFSLFLFRRSSPADRYRETLRAYQFISAIIAVIAILQFPAQFVIDGRKLISFFGIVPHSLLPTDLWSTIRTLPAHPSVIKSNGLFLVEPSALSVWLGLAIIIEVLLFRRRGYLILFVPALLVAYSGTGLLLVAAFLPLAVWRRPKARRAVLGVVILGAVLIACGIIHLADFTERMGEFDKTGSSAFSHFIAPLWETRWNFANSPFVRLLLGHGPGTSKYLLVQLTWNFDYSSDAPMWFKIWYEYGFIGALAFVGFTASCLRRSALPKLLIAAMVCTYLFLGNEILIPSSAAITMVLCTLSVRERGAANPSKMAERLVA